MARGPAVKIILGDSERSELEMHDYSALSARVRAAYFELTGGQFNKRALLSERAVGSNTAGARHRSSNWQRGGSPRPNRPERRPSYCRITL